MIKNCILTLIIAILFLPGCGDSNSYKAIKAGKDHRIDSPAGMIEYLKKQRLPALRSAELWQNSYGPGLKLTTKHYQVFTTLLEPLMLHQVPGFVESAYRGYQKQVPHTIKTSSKFNIYLFADRKQWEQFTDVFAGPKARVYKKIKVGAYYLNGSCVAYNIGREQTFSVLAHEGWHQFNSRHFRYRLPSWLDEGIAMLFEVSRYEQGLFYFEADRNLGRLGALRKSLIEKKMIPLKDLIGLNPGEVIVTGDDSSVMAFYSQSYALVRFLREEGFGKRLGNFRRMMLGGLRGDWPLAEPFRKIAADRNIPLTVRFNKAISTELFKFYIGSDFDALEKEYLAFCKKIVYHIRLKK